MKKPYEYQGYKGLDEIGKAFGVSKQTLSYRIRIQGRSVHDAIYAEKNQQVRKRHRKDSNEKSSNKRLSIRFPRYSNKLWMLALGIIGGSNE